jgi:propane monooxygenase small subunit
VPEDFGWLPGQYVDVHVPGAAAVKRSFSIASLPAGMAAPSGEVPSTNSIELMVKRYPGGRLSSMLGDAVVAGSELTLTGPYGAFHLRRSERPVLMVAGGSGMAPVLGVLRQLAAEGCERPLRFYYGAREERDLFCTDEIAALSERLADFRFHPVTGRFVHEAIDEELTDPDVYMCGPPPMLEAVEALLTGRGVDPGRIFQDRFTASADAADPEAPEAAGVRSAGTASEREFAWFKPAARRATLYEDVTVDTQPSIHRHLTRGWPLHFEDGRGIWSDASTALSSTDWFAFRDPGEQWERTYCQAGTAAEQQIEGALRSAAEQGLLADLRPEWTAFLHDTLQIPAFVEHGLWFALATAARDCLSDTVATCVCLQAAMKQRSAQAIVLYAMDLETSLGEPFAIETARTAFLREPAWQPTRRYLERLAATPDWAEVLFAANLCFEPTLATLLRRELGTRAAAAHGDTVTPVLARADPGVGVGAHVDDRPGPLPARRSAARRAQPHRAHRVGERLAASGARRRCRPRPPGRDARPGHGAGHRSHARLRRGDAGRVRAPRALRAGRVRTAARARGRAAAAEFPRRLRPARPVRVGPANIKND